MFASLMRKPLVWLCSLFAALPQQHCVVQSPTFTAYHALNPLLLPSLRQSLCSFISLEHTHTLISAQRQRSERLGLGVWRGYPAGWLGLGRERERDTVSTTQSISIESLSSGNMISDTDLRDKTSLCISLDLRGKHPTGLKLKLLWLSG